MERCICFMLFILMDIQPLQGECPRTAFKFSSNGLIKLYHFADSSFGNIGSLETCPYTGRPYVYLPCYQNSTWGDEPYFSNCSKPPDKDEHSTTLRPILSSPSIDPLYINMSIEDVAKLSFNSSYEASRIISYINQEKTNFQSTSQIISVVNIIDHAVSTGPNQDDQIYSNIYSIANRLLSTNTTSKMQEAQKSNQSIVKLLSSLETFSQNLRSTQPNQTFIEKNLAVSIVHRTNDHIKSVVGFAFDSVNNKIYPIESDGVKANLTWIVLDPDALSEQNRLTFSVYNHDNGLFDEEKYRVLTRLISFTIDKPNLTRQFQKFVKINFFLENDYTANSTANLTCAYWHIYENMTAQWSTDGCTLIEIVDRNVVCECDHLTHFAILMDAEQIILPRYVEQALSFITLIGLLLSSVGLSLTILTFILFEKLRHHFSQKALLLLSINLLFVNIFFSIIGLNRLTGVPCIITASLLHYFVISSFSWMFIMALIQYLLFVKVFPHPISAFTRKAAAFAQLVPLVPVVVVWSIDPLNYQQRSDGICWLNGQLLQLSFIFPILLYIVINSIIFSIVAHSLLCGKTGQQLRSTQMVESQRLSRFLVALSCFVVLGLTWVFGLLAIGPMRLLFQIPFCTFASLTGFFIFILYIITSKAKRKCWNNAFKTLGISTIYSPTLSTSSGLMGTREFSTTSSNDQQKVPSRLVQFPSQPQHFIDAYMPSSPPPPAPPLPLPPPFLIEGDDPLNNSTALNRNLYDTQHVWMPPTTYVYEGNIPTTSLDDYSLFYAANHDATKL